VHHFIEDTMRATSLLAFAGCLALTAPLAAQTAADTTGIRAAALDYIEGWYGADGARMERALHPELAKRNVSTDANGRSRLIQMTAMTLVQGTRNGGGSYIPQARRSNTVRILDIYQGAASVRVDAADWIDYMQLAKWNGRWLIVNVLWENSLPSPR
jgi:putative lumazine-binding protein